MADCITEEQAKSIFKHVDISKATLQNTSEKKRKTVEFDVSKIDHNAVAHFAETGDVSKLQHVFDVVDNGTTTFKILKGHEASEVASNLKEQDATDYLANIVAYNHISSAIKSNKNILDKLKHTGNLKEEISLFGEEIGMGMGLAEAIGRDIAIQNGIAVTSDKVTTATLYKQIGLVALKRLEKKGFIELNNNGGTFAKEAYGIEKQRMSNTFMQNTGSIIINEKMIELENKDNEKKSRVISAILDITLPKFIRRPSHEAVEHIGQKDVNVPTSIKDAMIEMQSKPLYLNKKYSTMFKDISDAFHTNLESARPFTVEKFLESYKDLFGLRGFDVNKSNINDINNLEDKEHGKQVSRFYTIKDIIMNYDEYFNENGEPKPIYLTQEVYRTFRWQYIENTFNPQLDSFFSRHALQQQEYVLNHGSREHLQALAHTIDEGLTHIGQSKYAQNKEAFINEMRNLLMNLGETPNASEIQLLNKRDDIVGKSAFEKLANLEAFVELSSSKTKDGTIKTTASTNPDASASGMIIQMLYALSEANSASSEYLENLLIIKGNGNSKEIRDAYQLLENVFQRKKNILGSNYKEDKLFDFIEFVIDIGLVKDMRSLLKIPTLSKSYMAGDTTAIDDISETLFSNISDMTNAKAANVEAALKRKADIFIKQSDIEPDIVEKMTSREMIDYYIEEAFSREALDSLREVYLNKITASNQAMAGKLYAALGALNGGKEIKVIPIHLLYLWKKNKKDEVFKKNDGTYYNLDSMGDRMLYTDKFGMPLMSKRTIFDKRNNVSYTDNVENSITAFVNLIHGTDAATQLISHIETQKVLKARDRDGDTTAKEALKTMPVNKHDSSGGNAIYNYTHQKIYRKTLLDIVSTVDILEPLLMSVEMLVNTDKEWKQKLSTVHMDAKKLTKYVSTVEKRLQDRKTLIDIDFAEKNAHKIYGDRTIGEPRTVEMDALALKIKNSKLLSGLMLLNHTKTDKQFLKLFEIVDSLGDANYNMNENKIQIPSRLPGSLNSDGMSSEEEIAHELSHAITASYIYSNETKKNPSDAIKYMKETIQFLNKNNNFESYMRKNLPSGGENMRHMYKRIQYALNQDTKEAVLAEFVAVLTGEERVAIQLHEVLTEMSRRPKDLLHMVQMIISEIKHFYNNIMKSVVDNVMFEKSFDENDPSANLMNALAAVLHEGSMFTRDGIPITNSTEPLVLNAVKRGEKFFTAFDDEFVSQTDNISEKFKKRFEFEITVDTTSRMKSNILLARVNDYIQFSLMNPVFFQKNSLLELSGKALDKQLSVSPLYRHQKDKIKDFVGSSRALQSISTWLFPENIGDIDTYLKMAGLAKDVEDSANLVHSTMSAKLEDAFIADGVSEKQKKFISQILTGSPLHLIMEIQNNDGTSMLKEILQSNAEELNLLTEKYEHILRHKHKLILSIEKTSRIHSGTFDPNNKNEISYDAIFNPEKTMKINEALSGLTEEDKAARMLYVLYSINHISENHNVPIDEFANMISHNKQSGRLIIDAMNHLMAQKNHIHYQMNIDTGRAFAASIVNESFKHRRKPIAFSYNEFINGDFSEDKGFVIIRMPTPQGVGIAYFNDSTSTMQSGIGTNHSFNNDLLTIKNPQAKGIKSGVVPDGNILKTTDYIVPLTYKEKKELGLIESASDTLYRTYAHRDKILETQDIRDALLTKAFHKVINNHDELDEFEKSLKGKKGRKTKWTVQFAKGINIQDVLASTSKFKNIKRLYKIPEATLSDVNNFNTQIDLVAVGAERMLFGYVDAKIFQKSQKAQKWIALHRAMVKIFKIHITALSPMKIARDVASNNTLLLALGVPTERIFKYSKEASSLLVSYNQLKKDIIVESFNGNKSKVEALKVRLKSHKFHVMAMYGMLQSQNVELIERDSDVLSGMEADLDLLLTKITDNNDIDRNMIAKGINAFMQFGISGDMVLNTLGSKIENIRLLETVGKKMQQSGGKLKKIRENSDVNEYIKEILGTSGSEMVKWGTGATQYADIVARYTYFMSQMEDGSTREEAARNALERFINYNMVPPKFIKLVDDMAFTLFSSYWLRIPRVLVAIGRTNSTAAGAFLLTHQTLEESGIHISNIYDNNVLERLFSDRGILNNPINPSNLDDVLFPPILNGLLSYV